MSGDEKGGTLPFAYPIAHLGEGDLPAQGSSPLRVVSYAASIANQSREPVRIRHTGTDLAAGLASAGPRSNEVGSSHAIPLTEISLQWGHRL
jgi:hypothetical protein